MLSLTEKIAGLLRNQSIPLDAVERASVETEPLAATVGWRSPGLALPGRRKIGTWRSRGSRHLVCARRGQPAVRLDIRGQKYDTLLIGDDAAATTVDRITRAIGAKDDSGPDSR